MLYDSAKCDEQGRKLEYDVPHAFGYSKTKTANDNMTTY